MSKLVLLLPDNTTLNIPLDRERLTIGRRSDNDLCLPNLAVSAQHAAVITIFTDSFLEDLGSTNGTLVNGRPITKHFLRDRDQIDIGCHQLIYCVDDYAVIESDVVRALMDASTPQHEAQAASAKPVLRTKPHPLPEGSEASVAVADQTSHGTMRVPSEDGASGDGSALASIKVLTGPRAGRSILLTKPQLTIGRPGVQVAAIVRIGSSCRLKLIKGEPVPAVNGQPVGDDGVELMPGDVIEIAGIRLEFVMPAQA